MNKQRFFLLTILSIVLKLFVSTLGHNFDMESWNIVSDIVLDGKNIYSNTTRYNYGYTWGLIIGCIKYITRLLNLNSIQEFHMAIVLFLSIIDSLIAIWLKNKFSERVAIFFLLNPISILLTGYHSQFENLAILLAIASAIPLFTKEIKYKHIIVSAILLGLSLGTKHVFFLFPIWFLLSNKYNFKQRLLYTTICYSVFLIFFIPFFFDPDTLQGIKDNILKYNALQGNALEAHFVYQSLPNKLHDYLQLISNNWLFRLVFFILLIGSSFLFQNKSYHFQLLSYLLCLLICTSMITAEYFILTIVAFPKNWTV